MIYLHEKGRVSFLEFKIPGGYQSENQKEWQKLCKSLGHTYRLIYNEEEFWDAVGLKNSAKRKAA